MRSRRIYYSKKEFFVTDFFSGFQSTWHSENVPIDSLRVCNYFVRVVDVTPTGFADGALTTFYRDVTPTGLKRKQVKNRGIPSVLKGHKMPSDVEYQKLYTPTLYFFLQLFLILVYNVLKCIIRFPLSEGITEFIEPCYENISTFSFYL